MSARPWGVEGDTLCLSAFPGAREGTQGTRPCDSPLPSACLLLLPLRVPPRPAGLRPQTACPLHVPGSPPTLLVLALLGELSSPGVTWEPVFPREPPLPCDTLGNGPLLCQSLLPGSGTALVNRGCCGRLRAWAGRTSHMNHLQRGENLALSSGTSLFCVAGIS